MKNDYLCNKKKIVFQNLYNQLNVTTFAVRNRVIHSLGRSALHVKQYSIKPGPCRSGLSFSYTFRICLDFISSLVERYF